MCFWIDGLRQTWLDKCLKSPASEDPSTSNMLNRLKNCSKLNDNTSTIFIDPCHGNLGWKSLTKWYAKSRDCLLTHWLPVTSIVFLKERIYCNIFRCNYLKNEKKKFNFFFHVLNLASIFNFFKKKMNHITDGFLNWRTPKHVVS